MRLFVSFFKILDVLSKRLNLSIFLLLESFKLGLIWNFSELFFKLSIFIFTSQYDFNIFLVLAWKQED